jgi:hypothetical protein
LPHHCGIESHEISQNSGWRLIHFVSMLAPRLHPSVPAERLCDGWNRHASNDR